MLQFQSTALSLAALLDLFELPLHIGADPRARRFAVLVQLREPLFAVVVQITGERCKTALGERRDGRARLVGRSLARRHEAPQRRLALACGRQVPDGVKERLVLFVHVARRGHVQRRVRAFDHDRPVPARHRALALHHGQRTTRILHAVDLPRRLRALRAVVARVRRVAPDTATFSRHVSP